MSNCFIYELINILVFTHSLIYKRCLKLSDIYQSKQRLKVWQLGIIFKKVFRYFLCEDFR